MAKRKVSTKAPAPAPTTAPTLAQCTFRWTEGPDEHFVTGETVARLIAYQRLRNPFIEGHSATGELLRVPPMLRGLGVALFPDAGDPVPDLDADRRFFLSEFLGDIAAEVHAAGLGGQAERITVHVKGSRAR
jgi:hypothetical protein